MRNLIAFNLLAAAAFAATVLTANFARAEMRYPAQPQLEVSCRDPRPIIDAGLMIRVYRLPANGGTTAYVAEQSIRGPVPVGSVRVVMPARDARYPAVGGLVYSGPAFMLSIMNGDTSRPDGAMRSYVRGNVGSARLDQDMLCNFVYHTM